MSDRPAVRRKTRDVLAAAFAAATAEVGEVAGTVDLSVVTVHYAGGMNDTKGKWSVVIGNSVDGAEGVTAVAKSATPRTDVYVHPLVVEVRDVGDPELGDDITQLILNVIDRTLFAGDRLSPLKVQTYPQRLDGPNPYQTEGTGAYLLSQAVRFVEFHRSTTAA